MKPQLTHGNKITTPRNRAGGSPNPFPMTKKTQTPPSLDYFGARYYSSGLSVWLSVDALAGKYPGTPAFMYVRGNPVMLVDKWGLKPEKDDPPKGMNPELEPEDPVGNYYGNGKKIPYYKNGSTSPSQPITTNTNNINIGKELLSFIFNLPFKSGGFPDIDMFNVSGIKPTYNNSMKYRNCDGNCYMATIGRVNKTYKNIYGSTPIKIIFNKNGSVTTKDYQLASSQYQMSNHKFYGYGVGGVLASKGLAVVVPQSMILS